MDTNRCHHASGCALESRRMAIAVTDELQEREGLGTNRALTALRDSSMSFGEFPAKHRASRCALERCLEGVAVLDGHKSVPSRERICPGVLSRGVRGARWTQIDAIARVNVPWRALEGRLPCQMNCRNVRDCALSDYRIPSDSGSDVGPCQMNCRKYQY